MLSLLLIWMAIVLENANFGNAQDYTVRLVNSFGNNSREGRLEIFYSGTWGTVCDDSFTNASAKVACNSLGFGYIGIVIGNRHGAGTGQIWLDNVICTGAETGIQTCAHDAWGVHDCSHGEDVSISCGPSASLCDEIFTGPIGTISSPNYPNAYGNNIDCSNYISLSSRHTVTITFLAINTEADCDWVTITCSSGNAFTARYSGSQIPAVLTILSCSRVTVNFRTDGSIIRTGFRLTYRITSGDAQDYAVRLNNSFRNSSKEGRLEIYYSGRWGTVCNNSFTNASARVACYSLGFGYIGSFIGDRHGAGINPVWLNKVNCVGTERGIHQCPHDGFGTHNRSGHVHSYDVSISCAECGTQHFYGSTGRISSPNFPQEYVNSLQCYNYITVPAGNAIIITFLAFSTERCCDFVTITCDSGNAFRSEDYSGFYFPAILTISSCRLVKVFFRTDGSATSTGFSLTYSITSDNIIGGIATRPSNAFPLSDQYAPIIFNCTTATKYLPWWSFSDASSTNYTITNSTCGIITSQASSWLVTETLGPGSCNLIVTERGYKLHRRAGSLVCTDSTLSSERVIILPIDLELKSTKGINLMATRSDMICNEQDTISCIPSLSERWSSPTVVFTHYPYSGSPVVRMRILRTYWTSQGNIISSTDISNTSSYVMVKALRDGVIPRHTCTVVFNFSSDIPQLRAKSPIEISFSTEPIDVLYWPTEDNMTIIGDNMGHVRIPALLYCNVAANPPATYTWIDESNGNITNGPTLTVYHGGKYMCNASNTIRGQHYQVSKTVNLEVCGIRYLSGPTETISSPNYPNAYTNNLDCHSFISVPTWHTVLITFLAFTTEAEYDWVAISCTAGVIYTSPQYSGSQIPAALTISSCSQVKVSFHTDGSTVHTGFNLKYNITPDCGNRNSSARTGSISSPNLPMAYINYLDCSYYISVTSGNTVIITFLTINFESSRGWVTITCASGNAFTSPTYSGSHTPAILTISACNQVKVSFRTYVSATNVGFSLTYSVTSDNVIGGFTTKPSNAFPRSNTDEPVIFNCTTATKYLPWWTFNDKYSTGNLITNSTCGVASLKYSSSWFKTETMGPGSCNLIVTAPANERYLLAGSFACTDSTLSSARAVLVPINLELSSVTGVNSAAAVTDIIRDEDMKLSCNSSFMDQSSSPSHVFTYFLYRGGPLARMRILRTYWTSEGNIVSSTDVSSAASYVLVTAPKGGIIPLYTCNIVFDLFSNMYDTTVNSTMEISISTKPVEVLYWPKEDDMAIIGENNGQIRIPALLYCNVPANPPATYTWIDESNGNITNGPIITVKHSGRYTCNASNIIRGQNYQQLKSVNLEVLKEETPQLGLLVLILGVSLGVAAISIIALLVILLTRKCRQKEGNTGVRDDLYGNEHEMRQRAGICNAYADEPGDALNAAESENEDEDNIYENCADEK